MPDTSSKFANAPPPIETEAALVKLARKAKATDVVIFIFKVFGAFKWGVF